MCQSVATTASSLSFHPKVGKKHLTRDHKKEKCDFVPIETANPEEDVEFPDDAELAAVKEEEAVAIEKSVGLVSATYLDIEPDFHEVLEVMDTDSEQQ